MPVLHELAWPRRTERLVLRPPTPEDEAAIWAFRRLPEVSAYLNVHYADETAFRERWARLRTSSLAVVEEGRVVGTAKLDLEDAESQAEVADDARATQAELGWNLDPAVQGRGIGTEVARALIDIAFGELGLRRVRATCAADNTGSWRVMEKAGMRREAHFREAWLLRDGRWIDTYEYALLASERAASQDVPWAAPRSRTEPGAPTG